MSPLSSVRSALEAWLMRAQAAVEGRASLDPGTEVAAAKQALGELDATLPTQPVICESCDED